MIPEAGEAIVDDLSVSPLFNLDQQLDEVMNRNASNGFVSPFDQHYYDLEEFLFDQGVIQQKYDPKAYVTDYYMTLVRDDPELNAFAFYSADLLSLHMIFCCLCYRMNIG